ncbi:MAG: PD-(D/E)XK nuclease family protein [Rothia sp. (in: high G+C Gram-positive bacteria)]|uniref:PD-(D/E)XK nuclease family protein n=1 Tax=Rothia sp. (in: high G+C Gram-positive bacteria) TaxID=1885016 RepID=UPI0026DF6F19|nr:PD-(D/E)XK nuclease family protein [Rothia sp. (in: high G+C Gram-positive bacteria)]MDO5751072.1 PD-(D/E)XK nuclease family protein [Rothia sp. (in: high G+C Gram-positive bacteria)]
MSSTFILGAPGTGKTHALIQRAVSYLETGNNPESLLILAPTRQGATRMRHAIARASERSLSQAPTRAWAAYAFDVLRRAFVLGLLPGVQAPPKLLSGPEQDTMIAEMLTQHRAGIGAQVRWPEDLNQALDTRGFRHELRDFFDRMAEYNLNADQVRQLGREHGHPEWVAVADFYTEYAQVRALRAPNAFDPSALIHRACNFLLTHPEFLAQERERFRLILIDDAQEMSPATYRLLGVLTGSFEYLLSRSIVPANLGEAARDQLAVACAQAPSVVITGCSENTLQGFRGARPEMMSLFSVLYPNLVQEHLSSSYRMSEPVAAGWEQLVRRLPVVPRAATVRQLQPAQVREEQQSLLAVNELGDILDSTAVGESALGVQAHLLASAQDEANQIAQMLLEDYLYRGRMYRESAIIVRNSSEVARLRRVLASAGIPTVTPSSLTPLRDEPAVRPFLDALALLVYTLKQSAQWLRLPELGAVVPGATEATSTSSTEAGETHTDPAENQANPAETNAEKLFRRSLHDVLAEEDRANPGSGAHNAISLLTSRLGGASSMEVRRLRQQLRAAELLAGGTRPSDELLLGALLDPEALPAEGIGVAARRVSAVLSAGMRALNDPDADAQSVLWELWEASGLERIWTREIHINGNIGPVAERAHRNLDAMIGLFESAERFTDQMPGSTPEQFLAYLDQQDLAMDSLAARGQRYDAVEILTPAQAASRSWQTVYVSGIQEGVWPNTTLRGSLLATADLVDMCDSALNGGEFMGTRSYAERARDVRHDELRMFASALSRAQKSVVLTAVIDEDSAPSEFFYALAPEKTSDDITRVRRPLTLRALVAQLRAAATGTDPVRAALALDQLHSLLERSGTLAPEYRVLDTENRSGESDSAESQSGEQSEGNNSIIERRIGIPGAHPSQWWGIKNLSSTDPIFTPRHTVDEHGMPGAERLVVPISPSRLERIHKSPLDWLVAAARAESPTDLSRSLGTLIHAIAEEMPAASQVELREELERRLDALNLPDTWESQQLRERAEAMIMKFSTYINEIMPGDERELVGVEGSFSVLVPGAQLDAQLDGRVDRLERDSEGKYLIADLKTGKHKPNKNEIKEHAQLAAYQVAIEAGAGAAMQARFEGAGGRSRELFSGLTGSSAGASLVQLGDGTVPTPKNRPQAQEPLGEDEKTQQMSAYLAQLASGALSYEEMSRLFNVVDEITPQPGTGQWAHELIMRAAELIVSSQVQARHRPGESCALPDICPLCVRGRQLTQDED